MAITRRMVHAVCAPIGGYVRGRHEVPSLSAVRRSPPRVPWSRDNPELLCIAIQRENARICRKVRGEFGLVCSQLTGTVSWWLTWLIFRHIGTRR